MSEGEWKGEREGAGGLLHSTRPQARVKLHDLLTSACLPVCLCLCLCFCLYLYLCFVCLSACLPACLSVCLSVRLSVCLHQAAEPAKLHDVLKGDLIAADGSKTNAEALKGRCLARRACKKKGCGRVG